MADERKLAADMVATMLKLISSGRYPQQIACDCATIVFRGMEEIEKAWEDDQGIHYNKEWYVNINEEIKRLAPQ